MNSKVAGSAAPADQWKAEVSQEFQAIFDVGLPKCDLSGTCHERRANDERTKMFSTFYSQKI